MRYDEILNENLDEIIDVFKTIRKDCSDIISAYLETGKVLYRGLTGTNKSIIKSESLMNRKPKDSTLLFQQLVDDWLTKHNFKALRSNSYFTTSDINQANGYGRVYLIFPVNGYDFTWFKATEDLYMSRYYFYSIMSNELKMPTNITNMRQLDDLYNNYKEKIDDSVDLFMKKISPSYSNINGAINMGGEVMFTGKYYAINIDNLYSKYGIDAMHGETIIDIFLKPTDDELVDSIYKASNIIVIDTIEEVIPKKVLDDVMDYFKVDYILDLIKKKNGIMYFLKDLQTGMEESGVDSIFRYNDINVIVGSLKVIDILDKYSKIKTKNIKEFQKLLDIEIIKSAFDKL